MGMFNEDETYDLGIIETAKADGLMVKWWILWHLLSRKYMMSVAAASVAETVTYPLDLTKTR